MFPRWSHWPLGAPQRHERAGAGQGCAESALRGGLAQGFPIRCPLVGKVDEVPEEAL